MDKKERIIEAALTLFNMYGFDKTTTAKISKEAGVAIGTLFNYFETKEELINITYLNCKDSLSKCLEYEVNQEKTVRSKLKKAYVNVIGWGLDKTDEFLFFQQFSNSPHIREITRKEGLSKFNNLAEIITEGIETEIIRNVNVDYINIVIVSIIIASTQYVIENPSLAEDDKFLETSFSFLWDSIRK